MPCPIGSIRLLLGWDCLSPFTPSDVEVNPEKAVAVGQRSVGRKRGADELDDIKSSLTD